MPEGRKKSTALKKQNFIRIIRTEEERPYFFIDQKRKIDNSVSIIVRNARHPP